MGRARAGKPGHRAYNEEQLAHGGQAIGLGRYLASSDFGRAVMENWQSEYLQFGRGPAACARRCTRTA